MALPDGHRYKNRIPTAAEYLTLAIEDMTLPDDAKPNGITDGYSWWADQPGKTVPWSLPTVTYKGVEQRFSAVIPWFQVYEAANTSGEKLNSANNARINVRNWSAWFLNSRCQWTSLYAKDNSDVETYVENYSSMEAAQADRRVESDDSISIKLKAGKVDHGWPKSGRKEIVDHDNWKGFYATLEARLVLDKHSDSDERATTAKYVMNLGIDIWLNINSVFDNYLTNYERGQSRFKLLTSEFQRFHVYSFAAGYSATSLPVA